MVLGYVSFVPPPPPARPPPLALPKSHPLPVLALERRTTHPNPPVLCRALIYGRFVLVHRRNIQLLLQTHGHIYYFDVSSRPRLPPRNKYESRVHGGVCVCVWGGVRTYGPL